MSNLQHKSTRKSKNIQTDKKVRNSFLKGSLIATFIAITPYLFYLHESVPETKVWNTFLFTFESHFYEDANAAMWIISMKAIPLILLLIWFFTCRHWWYHALLVPIAMFAWQLVGAFSVETKVIDEFQLMHLVPIMAIIIPSIYLIRARMFNKLIERNQTLEEIEEEFKIKPKGFLQKLNDYF